MSTEPFDPSKAQTLAFAALDSCLSSDYFGRSEENWYDGVAGGLGGPAGELCGYLSPSRVIALVDELTALKTRTFVAGVAAERHEEQRGIAEEAFTDAVRRAREAEEILAKIRELATEWATQATDYDDDTEQQIADGRTILAALKDVK